MAVSQIGLNLTALSNLTAPNISINTTASGVLSQIAADANAVTYGYLGYIILISTFILLYWVLSDKSPISEFKYSDMRALALAAGYTSIMGLVELSAGYIESFTVVGMCMFLYMVFGLTLAAMENKVQN